MGRFLKHIRASSLSFPQLLLVYYRETVLTRESGFLAGLRRTLAVGDRRVKTSTDQWRSSQGRVRLQQQARALGDPTRFAIFQEVAAGDAPVRVAALTQRFGLNHNAVRQHLAKLCDAGLLVEEFAPRSGPGRPALQYRLGPGVHGMWATPSPYEELSLYLLEIARSGRSAREVGIAAGRQAAAALDHHDAPTADRLIADHQRRGFEPRVVPEGASIDIVLDLCPYARAAAVEPATVCEIHWGLVEGFVEGTDLTLKNLKAKDPTRAGCRLRLEAE